MSLFAQRDCSVWLSFTRISETSALNVFSQRSAYCKNKCDYVTGGWPRWMNLWSSKLFIKLGVCMFCLLLPLYVTVHNPGKTRALQLSCQHDCMFMVDITISPQGPFGGAFNHITWPSEAVCPLNCGCHIGSILALKFISEHGNKMVSPQEKLLSFWSLSKIKCSLACTHPTWTNSFILVLRSLIMQDGWLETGM